MFLSVLMSVSFILPSSYVPKNMPVRFNEDSKLSVVVNLSVNGCLSKCQSVQVLFVS